MKNYFFLILIILLNTIANCQSYNQYIHFNTENGLPTNNIYNGIVSKEGYLFLNSNTGLIRYDGYEFKNYEAKDGLLDVDILYSQQDNMGRIWIIPFNGSIFYYLNGKIHNKKNDSLLKTICDSFKSDGFFYFNICEEKYICLSKPNEKKVLTIENNSCNYITLPDSLNITSVYNTGNEIYLQNGNNIERYKDGVFNTINHGMHTIGGKLIFKKLNNNLYNLDFINSVFIRLDLKTLQLKNIIDYKANNIPVPSYDFIEHQNKIFFSGGNKVFKCDTNFTNIHQVLKLNKQLIIKGIYFDNNSNLWVLTITDGIYYYKLDKSIPIKNVERFDENLFKQLYIDETGNVYLCTSDYFYKIIRSNNKFVIEKKISLNEHFGTLKKIINSNKYIYVLFEFNKIIRFSKIKNSIEHAPFGPLNSIGSIKDIQSCTDTSFLISTSTGAFLFIKNRKVEIYNSRTTCVAYDKNSNIAYIGTLQTVIKVNVHDNKKIDLSLLNPILNDKIISIKMDQNNILWIATASNGVVAYKEDKILFIYSEKTGLINNTINGISIDKQKLIVSTNNGVSVLEYSYLHNKFSKIISKDYNSESGLPDDFVNDATMKDSILYAATNNGIGIINCNTVMNNKNKHTEIIQIKVNDKEVIENDLQELKYFENFIRIKFTSFNYNNKNSYYKSRLLPVENNWVISNQNIKEFGPLEPNEYNFEIVACNKNGEDIGKITSVKFKINKVFWQTWWFKTVLLLISLLMIYLLIKNYSKQKKHEIDHQHQLSDLKMKALRAQMNPHFIFNCLNTIQGFINEGSNIDSNRFITKFSSLIRQTLNNSNESFITIENEIEYLNIYLGLEKMRFNNSFNFSISVDESKSIMKEMLPSMLIQPLAENSIRHGLRNLQKMGNLTISFNKNKQYLEIKIEDNGIGINNKSNEIKLHTSKGLELIHDRIKTYSALLEKNIILEIIDNQILNNSKTGTTILLKIPN